ncbi:MAG: hypothetical protein WBC93_01155 [Sulfitobacter sp.]
MDDEFVKDTCKVGQGATCCKYLMMGNGWECAKASPSMKSTIDARDMNAKGDNCPGFGLKQYVLKADLLGYKSGEKFVESAGYDYGMKSDHERITGEPHINLSADGGYPFICVPVSQADLVT